MEKERRMSLKRRVGKYFLHGMLFAVISLGLYFLVLVFIFTAMIQELFAGLLIVVLVLLILIFSRINVFLTSLLWDISVKTDLSSLFWQGLLLTIAFELASIPLYIAGMFVSGVLSVIVSFIVYCFINGFIAKNVGSLWEEGSEEGIEAPVRFERMSYEKEMEKGRKEHTLSFEMWLRYVKNMTLQQIFELKNETSPDPARDRELQEEYAKWKGKNSSL